MVVLLSVYLVVHLRATTSSVPTVWTVLQMLRDLIDYSHSEPVQQRLPQRRCTVLTDIVAFADFYTSVRPNIDEPPFSFHQVEHCVCACFRLEFLLGEVVVEYPLFELVVVES